MSEQPTASPLTEFEIHDVLRNERRTRVLEHLRENRETVPLRELSERIAALETGERPPPRNVRESVYDSLHQTHLPKLDDMGVVDYDRDRKRVALANGSDQVSLYMEAVSTNDVPWATYYLGTGLLALVTTGLSSAGTTAFAALPVAAWGGIFLGIFVLSAVYRAWQRQSAYLGPS